MIISAARITALPKLFSDPMPEVYVTLANGEEKFLFEFYPDEINFNSSEFIGLTEQQAHHLKFIKDKSFLQS
jgi:hypothetical protein